MAFVPENPLEAALMNAPNDPVAQVDFYRLLMVSRLFALGDANGKTGDISDIPVGATFTLATATRGDAKFHPVFTAMSRLVAFGGENAPHVYASGRSLFENTRGGSFVLNPGSERGKELLPDEIAYWLDPPKPRALNAEQRLEALVGQPAEYPKVLADALCVLFANRSDVARACLAQIAFAQLSEPPHPLIGVETSGDFSKISAEITQIAEFVSPGAAVDVSPLGHPGQDDTLSAYLRNLAPFYQRKPN